MTIIAGVCGVIIGIAALYFLGELIEWAYQRRYPTHLSRFEYPQPKDTEEELN